jgi:hypothetical protein
VVTAKSTAKLGEKREKSRLYCVKYQEYGKRHAFPLLKRESSRETVAVSAAVALSVVSRGPRGTSTVHRVLSSPISPPTLVKTIDSSY